MRRALASIPVVLAAATAAGHIWSPVGPDLFPALCGAISSSNPRIAVVAVAKGATATLYLTTDRGSTWARATNRLTFRPLAISFQPGSDSVLYAAGGGVFKSTDRGQAWSPLATRDGTFWLNLTTDSNEVWVSGYSDASAHVRASVALSTDEGTNWTLFLCDTTLRSSAHSIAPDPAHDSILYCGGSIAGKAVVYKSTDRGSTWTTHVLPSSMSDSIGPCSPPPHEIPGLGPGAIRVR